MKTKNYIFLFLFFLSIATFSQFNNGSITVINPGTCSDQVTNQIYGEYTYTGVENGRPYYLFSSTGDCSDRKSQAQCVRNGFYSFKLSYSGTRWEINPTTEKICFWELGEECNVDSNGTPTFNETFAHNTSTSNTPPSSGWVDTRATSCSFVLSEIPQLFITEYSTTAGTNNKAKFIEIFNNSDSAIDITGYELRSGSTSGSTGGLNTFTFGTDEAAADADVIVPANGFLIVGNGATRTEFNTDTGITLSGSVNFNSGNEAIFFVNPTESNSWTLFSLSPVFNHNSISRNASNVNGYKNIVDSNVTESSSISISPGSLEYNLFTNGSFVNSATIDETTGSENFYFYGNPTLSGNTSVNNITTTGSVKVSSGNSLIVNGTFTGNLSYTRNLSTSNWYLISSPVVGQNINEFVSSISGGLQTGTQSNNIGLGLSYDTSNNTWTYLQSGASGTGNFNSGQGYSINLENASGDITFKGTMLTDDLTPVNLSTSGDGFNLIANPYPSYVNASTLLTDNTGSLDQQTIWVWDQEDDVYDALGTVSNFKIAPAQAFFVKSNGASGTLGVNESYQSHQSTDSFQKSAQTKIVLNLTDGDKKRYATFYYLDNVTTGFDNGYDAELFGGSSYSLAIYSELVSQNIGKKYQIQSTPKADMEKTIIPLGIIASKNTEVTISANFENIPNDLNVYLEDRETNTFTLLETNVSKYSVTLEDDIKDIGRFFLHTKSKVLSTITENLKAISMYKTEDNTLKVTGINSAEAVVKAYSVLGKKVFETSFTGNGVNVVDLPKLKKGIYVFHLSTTEGEIKRKLIID